MIESYACILNILLSTRSKELDFVESLLQATFNNGPANLLYNLPKNPPNCINFFICALLNFISVAELLL